MRGRISELRQTMRDRILETPASDFKQGTAIPTWKEVRRPYKVLDDSHARKHLLFSVDVASASAGIGARGNIYEGYEINADVRVQFMYRVRASDHDDEDSASDAAEALAGSILKLGAEDHRYNIDLIDLFSPSMAPDGESLLVEMRFSARFSIPFPVGD
tara:strand:- start:2841 stop:3317 length:477 start_codon:yes stop_codon:yes gene_type:complete